MFLTTVCWRAGLTQNNSSSNNNSSTHNTAPSPPPKTKSEPRSSLDPLNSSRMRLAAPDAENQGAPPAKRSRPSAASRAHAANHSTAGGGGGVDDDDIQEVVPVKAEPTGASSGGVVGSVSGTMAMYDEGTEEEGEELVGYEDSTYQEEEEEEYGEYGEAEQYNMAGGAQDASSGRREARVLLRGWESQRGSQLGTNSLNLLMKQRFPAAFPIQAAFISIRTTDPDPEPYISMGLCSFYRAEASLEKHKF